ncbi:MAG: hypothetical protein EZS28_043603, partial [Streblomastix strix]
IDLETWFYKTKFQATSLIPDIPIFCPFIETVGGNGLNNVCFKQNLVDAPVLWFQNMLSQDESIIGSVDESVDDSVDGFINGFINDMDKFIDVVDKQFKDLNLRKRLKELPAAHTIII